MNRSFLLFLMVGTAMMIAVIGQHKSSMQIETMPWEVDQLDNNSIRVFGITLEKTTIQESNQILAQFGKTLLEVNTGADQKTYLALSSTYDDLVIGGLLAQIKIIYQLDQKKLQTILHSIHANTNTAKNQTYLLNSDIEMAYLNTPIFSITYTPSIDFGQDTLRQNFGMAAEEIKLSEDEQVWHYPEMSLKIYISKNKPDRFIYSPLNQTINEHTPMN